MASTRDAFIFLVDSCVDSLSTGVCRVVFVLDSGLVCIDLSGSSVKENPLGSGRKWISSLLDQVLSDMKTTL